MHTGDLATMDAEGYVNIVGRIKDMVIRGGENIYPREIEEFLYRHPKVQDVQVVGVPDKKYGEELCAWIILKPGQAAHGRRGARLLQGPDRALQGAALHPIRHGVPDDRDRQDPEIQDPRSDEAAARPRREDSKTSMSKLETKLNARSADFQANAAAMRALVDDLHAQFAKVEAGGGEAARSKHTGARQAAAARPRGAAARPGHALPGDRAARRPRHVPRRGARRRADRRHRPRERASTA